MSDDNGGNWKSKLTDVTREIVRKSRNLGKTGTLTKLRTWKNLDPAAMLAKVAGWGGGLKKQRASFYLFYATLVLCAWFIADIASIYMERFIPEPPVARSSRGGIFGGERKAKSFEEYGVIVGRNLFNSEGKIPGENAPEPGIVDQGGAPVLTSLPFTLIGTLILQNELRSIATIEDKAASNIYPVRAQDEIPQKAKILEIGARKVIFLNLANGRREFVELPEEFNDKNPRITLGTQPKGGTGIERVSPTQFNVSRAAVDKSLANLNQVLTQARAVPNFENGMPAGYKLFQIVPGSIYEQLGLQNGDTLMGINGESINDPGKAFELLNQLKTASNLELSVKRDGKTSSWGYEIR